MKTILAVTTDPSKMIQGYSLEFQRCMGVLSKKYKVLILTNARGKSYQLIKDIPNSKINSNLKYFFIALKHKNYFIKGLEFILSGFNFKEKWDICISNGELPDLLLSWLLCKKNKRKSVAVVHDDYQRNKSMRSKLVLWARRQIIKRFDVILFVNKYTMRTMKEKYKLKSNLGFMGWPICDDAGRQI